jgi:DNA invertase Pin-like site-specific DNA recombinase
MFQGSINKIWHGSPRIRLGVRIQVDRIFTDKASGKDTQCSELDALLAFVRDGDTLVVHSMDRLARNLDDLRRIAQELTQRGIRIEVVIDTLKKRR